MKNVIWLMLLVLIGSVLSSVQVSAELGDPGFAYSQLSFIDQIKYNFAKGLFSNTIYGQERRCSVTSSDSGYVTDSDVPKTIACPGLIDIYRVNSVGGWNFIDEVGVKRTNWPVTWTFNVKPGTPDKWAWECYNCPYQACAVNSDCSATYGNTCNSATGSCYFAACTESWSCGSWSTCTSWGTQTRVCSDYNKCGTIKNKPVESRSCTYSTPTTTCTNFIYSDWGLCTNGKQTRTIVSSSPSGCSGGNSITSQACSSCSSNWQCSDWNICSSSNTQTRTCTDSNNCGSTFGKPIESQSCTFDSTTTPSIDTTAPNFQVDIVRVSSPIRSSGDAAITVQITNNGGPGTMNVEAGIYKWGTDSIGSKTQLQAIASIPTTNCEPQELNVKTYAVTLGKGETKIQEFIVKAPQVCKSTLSFDSATTTDYGAKADAYLNCYNSGKATGLTSFDLSELTIEKDSNLFCSQLALETCYDGVANQKGLLAESGEPSTDCGAVCKNEKYEDGTPRLCRDGYSCYTSLDCSASSYCNDDKRCTPVLTSEQQAQVNAEKEASDTTVANSACPAPDSDQQCIPADCPYIDSDSKNVFNVFTLQPISKSVTTICCEGATHKQLSSTEFSLKYVGAAAGGVTGALVGKTTLTTALGGGIGWVVGDNIYSDTTNKGMCTKETSISGVLEGLKSFTCPIAETVGVDCTVFTYIIIGLGIFFIIRVMAK